MYYRTSLIRRVTPPEKVHRVSKRWSLISDMCKSQSGTVVDFRLTKTTFHGENNHRSDRGNYLRFRFTDFLTRFCVIFLLFVIISPVHGNIMGDQCDWTGNGLTSSSQNRGVVPVYLRCSQGHVKWAYPKGALRVVFRLPNSDRDFKGCVRVSRNFSGAQLFLVGARSLTRIFSLNDGGEKDLVRCFQSRNGQAAIYVEAVEGKGIFEKEIAGFSYDLQAIPRGSSYFDLVSEECRPCSRKEVAHAFCTSDLVTRGLIFGIDDKQLLEIAEISIKITKVLRRVNDDFTIPNGNANGIDEDEIEDVRDGWKLRESEVIKMTMPRHCDPQQGPGEFVFMGRKRLGDLTLMCATSLSDWAEIVRTMNADGTSHCVLKI